MAFFLKDLAADPSLLDDLRDRQPKPVCKECACPLHHGFCQDCYHEGVGKLVEEHPIVSAGIRRS